MIYLYLLLGYSLSAIGFLVYHFIIKNKITPQQRKTYIYSVVALSLALPALFMQSAEVLPSANHVEIVEPDEFVNEPVLDEALASCYDKIETQEGLCHCEQLQQSNLLYYQPNQFYDFIITNKATIRGISIGIAGLIALGLLMKIAYLLVLICKGETQKQVIEGKTYRILRQEGDFMAASFRLWHRYILWHPALDKLSESEQQGILMHEVAHLRNGDTFEQIGLYVLQIFWIINPVFYFIKKELDIINEFIADQFALNKVGNAHSYATLLVKLKEKQQLGLANHLGYKGLKNRILAILKPQQFIYMRYMPAIIGLVAAAMLAFSASTAPLVSEQYAIYEEYCLMHDEFSKTGKNTFCRPCLYEDLKQDQKEMGNEWGELVKHEH